MSTLRMLVLLPGAALLVVAILYLLLEEALPVFTIPVTAIVIIIGIKLSPSPKISGGKAPTGPDPLIVDRAILGASIYQLFFFDTRLVLKRLATAKTTIFSLVLLAFAGFLIDDLIGALAGVTAGYAIQEYTAQARRVKSPVTNSSLKVGPNDVEVPYDDLEKVELDGNKLVLFSKRGITRLGMSRGYGAAIAPRLTTIFQKKFKETGVSPFDRRFSQTG